MKQLSDKTVGWIDAFFAVMFAGLFIWAIHAANEAAADAVRRYGYNTDSGALIFFGAVVYLAPVALAFAIASFALLLGWRFNRLLHWVAWLGAVGAPVGSTMLALAN